MKQCNDILQFPHVRAEMLGIREKEIQTLLPTVNYLLWLQLSELWLLMLQI